MYISSIPLNPVSGSYAGTLLGDFAPPLLRKEAIEFYELQALIFETSS